ncbi:MAG: DUF1540 domain-containing protein [Oscillospiraceae bacterium]|nr:DUF1540 domain-containing protein [Oscillospiraceae bacterium]
MNNNKDCVNKSIECSVTNCANHCCNGENYCALQKITVGTHGNGQTPQNMASTDCRSFVEK